MRVSLSTVPFDINSRVEYGCFFCAGAFKSVDAVPEQEGAITCSFMVANRSAIAVGKHVKVYEYGDGLDGLQRETVLEVTADESLDHLLEISPRGDQVAFSERSSKRIALYDIPSGSKQELDFEAGCDGVRWSARGRYMIAWGGFGAALFERKKGGSKDWQHTHSISDPNYYIGDCTFSSDEKFLATCGASKMVFIRRLTSLEEPVLTIAEGRGFFFTAAVCFSPDCKWLAYCASDPRGEHVRICEINVDAVEDADKCREVCCVGDDHSLGPWDSTVKFCCHPKAFSNDGKMLVLRNSVGSAFEGGLTMVDTDPTSTTYGHTFEWNIALAAIVRTIATSAASLIPVARWGVGWIPDTKANLLYLACGRRQITIDVDELALAAEDGCMSCQQMVAVSKYRPDLIGSLVEKSPFILNRRDPETGDTVVHECARSVDSGRLLSSWLMTEQTETQLGGCGWLPIANKNMKFSSAKAEREGCGRFGRTALHEAIATHSTTGVTIICQALHKELGPIQACLLQDALALLAITMPESVAEALTLLEPSLLLRQPLSLEFLARDDVQDIGTTVRVEIHREEARASDVFMANKHGPSDNLGERKHVWRKFQSDHPKAEEEPVHCFVLALAGFLGNACAEDESPKLGPSAPCTNNRTYSLIVKHCGSEVYNSRIMRLATQFKWETSVKPLQTKLMFVYFFGVCLSTATMLSCTNAGTTQLAFINVTETLQIDARATEVELSSTNIALVAAMIIWEVGVLSNECYELVVEGLKRYMSSPWNVCDSVSSICLLAAALCHVLLHQDSEDFDKMWLIDRMADFGGVGILLKWTGVLDYLRLWSTTASHIRMISQIAMDVTPFFIVIFLGVVSTSFSFRVLLPNSFAFSYTDSRYGVLKPFITIFRLLVGDIDINAMAHGTVTIFVLLLAIFFLAILMLNMVIADMGDSYQRVKQGESEEICMEKAKMITTMEKLYPSRHQYAKYMHILQPAQYRPKHAKWEGLGGTLKRMAERTDKKFAAVETKIDKIEAGLNLKLDNLVELLEQLNNTKK